MSDDKRYDLVIIGGGPGGYVAAIRAAQNGMTVLCVDKRGRLGGTCLNVGCIPSKALLQSSHLYEEAAGEHFAGHGIKASPKLDLKTMLGRKDEVVTSLTDGIEGLFKKYKVELAYGFGKIVDRETVSVTPNDKKKAYEVKTDTILIATGSDVATIPNVEIDEERIVSSTGALDLKKVPKSMIVIGGGYIGLELGSVWRRLGAEVTVVEFLDRILPNMDNEVSKRAKVLFSKQGIEFKVSTKVTGAEAQKTQVKLTVEPAKGGDAEELKADVVLVAVGRRPYTEDLGLEDLGIETEKGFIPVDEHFQTSVPGVFAIGDCIPGPMLAHKAEHEGAIVADHLAGEAGHIDYDRVPGVVYTWPEIASIGRTEEQLKEADIAYNVGKFPFSANSRARSIGEKDGMVKILADKESDQVLGVHIIGPDAGNMIHEALAVMELGGTASEVGHMCHAHPTLNEAVKEAAMAVRGQTINM
ncbi:MAG: dihydrolipoyl dehydrogenase [Rhizobiales bacterium NRL2]|jgi:dihydrolipoamide dehydrogenase|nr:MAG: dihydrolipoyl dehydrogenase [Rhizobiales bacterium NRL2]